MTERNRPFGSVSNADESHLEEASHADVPPKESTTVRAPLRSGNAAFNIWRFQVKPWVTKVIATAFVLVSLAQSITFVAKYIEDPIITITTIEDVTADDTPWITICPAPGIDFAQISPFVSGDQSEMRRRLFDGSNPLTLPVAKWIFLAAYLEGHNLTLQEALEDRGILVPPWHYIQRCLVLLRNGTAGGRSRFCHFPEDVSRYLKLETEKSLEHKTPAGVWETAILEPLPGSFLLCSTFKPHSILMHPDVVNQIYIGLTDSSIVKRNVNAPGQMSGKTNGTIDVANSSKGFPSTFGVYITQPWEKPSPHQWFNPARPVVPYPIALGKLFVIEISYETYKFMSKPQSHEGCLSESGLIQEIDQCRLICFESLYMADATACRYPGYRNYSGSLAKQFVSETVPKVCKTAEDIRRSKKVVHSSQGISMMMQCRKRCGEPCIRYSYDWRATDIQNYQDPPSAAADNEGSANDLGPMTSLRIMFTSPYSKSIEQQPAYSFHQMLGEIGGSWGLFLGLSFSAIFTYAEQVLMRIFNQHQAGSSTLPQ